MQQMSSASNANSFIPSYGLFTSRSFCSRVTGSEFTLFLVRDAICANLVAASMATAKSGSSRQEGKDAPALRETEKFLSAKNRQK